MKPKHPPGPPMTLGNMREHDPGRPPLLIQLSYNAGGLATMQEQHERERRAQNCLAKVAYCKWVASITADKQVKDYYAQLSHEWKREAEATKAGPR